MLSTWTCVASIAFLPGGGKPPPVELGWGQFPRVTLEDTHPFTCLDPGQLLLLTFCALLKDSRILKEHTFKWLKILVITQTGGGGAKKCQKKLPYPRTLKCFLQNLGVTDHKWQGTWSLQGAAEGGWKRVELHRTRVGFTSARPGSPWGWSPSPLLEKACGFSLVERLPLLPVLLPPDTEAWVIAFIKSWNHKSDTL